MILKLIKQNYTYFQKNTINWSHVHFLQRSDILLGLHNQTVTNGEIIHLHQVYFSLERVQISSVYRPFAARLLCDFSTLDRSTVF